MTALGRMSSLSLAISGRLMECNSALLNSRLHATARPSLVLYPPRSLKFVTDSKLMCRGYDSFIWTRSLGAGPSLGDLGLHRLQHPHLGGRRAVAVPHAQLPELGG